MGIIIVEGIMDSTSLVGRGFFCLDISAWSRKMVT